MAKRMVLEHTNLETGKKTTYYVRQISLFMSCVYLILALCISILDLTSSIICFLVAVFFIWEATDIVEEDVEKKGET